MIYWTADPHGYQDIGKLNNEEFRKVIKPEDYLAIAGDFGGLWRGDVEIPTPSDFPDFLNPENLKTINQDKLILDWYESLPFTVLFIDGNHENFDAINSYPVSEWHGGDVHIIRPNLIHLMRGQIFDIEGYKIFTMGGAQSPDRGYHIVKDKKEFWWEEELPTWDECNNALAKLEENGWTVDFILTHCLPDNLIPYYFNHNIITNLLFSIDKQTTFKHWYCGHYHLDEDRTDKHTILFNNIRDINNNIIC